MKRSILFLLLPLALVLAACSAQVKPPASTQAQFSPTTAKDTTKAGAKSEVQSLERYDEQGAVSVTVIPANLKNSGDSLEFDVSLQTHMVDLSMDFAALSTLKTDTGVMVKATSWEGPTGGHHVKGKLFFPTSQDGNSVLQGAKTLTLTIQNVDAPERTFSWDIMK